MIVVAFLRDQGSVKRGNEVGQRRRNVEDVEIVVEEQYRHLDEVVRCWSSWICQRQTSLELEVSTEIRSALS